MILSHLPWSWNLCAGYAMLIHQLLQGTHMSWHFCQPQMPYPGISLQKPCPAVGHSFVPALASEILQGTSVQEILCLIKQGRSNHSP